MFYKQCPQNDAVNVSDKKFKDTICILQNNFVSFYKRQE